MDKQEFGVEIMYLPLLPYVNNLQKSYLNIRRISVVIPNF